MTWLDFEGQRSGYQGIEGIHVDAGASKYHLLIFCMWCCVCRPSSASRRHLTRSPCLKPSSQAQTSCWVLPLQSCSSRCWCLGLMPQFNITQWPVPGKMMQGFSAVRLVEFLLSFFCQCFCWFSSDSVVQCTCHNEVWHFFHKVNSGHYSWMGAKSVTRKCSGPLLSNVILYSGLWKKTAEPDEDSGGPKEPWSHGVQIPQGQGANLGVVPAIQKHWQSLLRHSLPKGSFNRQ